MNMEILGAQGKLATEIADAAALLRRSTVEIKSSGHGVGSGVIWRSDGLIMTNAHVVRGHNARVELSDGRNFNATVISSDRQRDLASLKIDAAGLPAAPIGDSNSLRVGELVLAMGNPHGVTGALTVGIVHAVGTAGWVSQSWVQADLRLAPGNSGGPMIDAKGRVVGINTMISGELALAVPSNAVKRFLLRRTDRPRLGMLTQSVGLTLGGKRMLGLMVMGVDHKSMAEKAGLVLGDVLVKANGRPFGSLEDLQDAVQNTPSGNALSMDLVRNGRVISLSVVFEKGLSAEAA